MLITSLISCLLICVVAAEKSAIIIHNMKNFKVTHSEFISQTRKLYPRLKVYSTKDVGKYDIKIKEHKEFVYDLVVYACSRDPNSLRLAEKLELTSFYDQGGSLLMINDGVVLQPWRILLSMFGFDQLQVDRQQGYLNVQKDLNSSRVFIPKEQISFEGFTKDLKEGIYYKGGAIVLTPYENSHSWGILKPEQGSLFVDARNSTHQILDTDKNNLIAGAQGQSVTARMLVVGSIELFGNEFINLSKGDNMHFFVNLLNWLKFDKNRIEVSHFTVCENENIACEQQNVFNPYKQVCVTLRLKDEEGNMYFPPNEKVYLKLVMFEIFLQQPLEIERIDGELYYRRCFYAFHHLGVYKLSIEHPRPTYFLNEKEHEREIIFKLGREEHSEIARLPSFMYLITILGIFSSAIFLSKMVINNKTKNQ